MLYIVTTWHQNKLLTLLQVVSLSLILAMPTFAGTVVVVKLDNPIAKLSKSDIRSIFLGKLRHYPGTSLEAIALDQARKSAIRAKLYRAVARKTPRKMSAYWARQLFTGTGMPPETKDGDLAILAAIQADKRKIGYIASTSVTEFVKVVYQLEPDKSD